jgi:branched-chain amino acid transport system permease protein
VETFVAQIADGLATGSIYALIVLGMNLLILVRGVVHFAYAHLVVITMYIAWIVLEQTNNNLVIAIPVAIFAAVLLLILTEPLFRPLALRRAFLETLIVALGIAIILTEIMSHFIHHGEAIAFPPALTGGGAMLRTGMISFSLADAYTLFGSIVVVLVLLYLLYHHKHGRAFRAMAQDLRIARLLGIPFKRTGIYGFAIAGILAGVVSVLVAMSLGLASSSLGDTLAIKAMVLILFAGMGNLKGGMICALLMGIAEAMALSYLPGRWTEAVIFGAIMIVIIWRPQGLFGAKT